MKLTVQIAFGIILAGTVASLTALVGCADLREKLPTPVSPGVKAHDAAWVDTASASFHGKVVARASGDVQGCLKCHGLDYSGGTSGVSCVVCHRSAGASLHGRGWIERSSPNFHGKAIRTANWDMRSCQSCHGAIYDGGKVRVSCRTCHSMSGGPENCTTCHGSSENSAPPHDIDGNTARSARGVGAHQVHFVGTTRATGLFCSTCHDMPPTVYTSGHVDSPLPAEVIFNSSLARTVTNNPTSFFWDPARPPFVSAPTYDASLLKCSNTYCHGYFKNGNTTFAPVWNDTTGSQAACGTCHGNTTRPTLAERARPTGTHPNATQCSFCHYKVASGDLIDANLNFVDKTKHIDGKVMLFGQEREF